MVSLYHTQHYRVFGSIGCTTSTRRRGLAEVYSLLYCLLYQWHAANPSLRISTRRLALVAQSMQALSSKTSPRQDISKTLMRRLTADTALTTMARST